MNPFSRLSPQTRRHPWLSCGGLMFAVLLAGAAHQAFANPLSFDAALALALRETPALKADSAQIIAARQAAIPAGELPDPKLALGIDNLPLEGPDRYSLTGDFMTMQRIGLMQEFPNQAKRDARVKGAAARVALMEANERITRQTVLRETALAWIARHALERQLARMDELFAENRLFEAAVRAQIAGGKGAAADAVMPRQEAAMIDERRDELLARRDQAIAQLRRWIGARADAPLEGEAPQWTLRRESLGHRLHRHPELAAFDPRARVLDAEVSEARAGKRPDWALEMAYLKRGAQFGDMAMAQISFDLPLFAASRQNPMIAARQAERMALDAEREASTREHAAMLETDFAEYQRLLRAETRINTILLPLAEEKTALALAAWRGGKGSLIEVIAARRERIETLLNAIVLTGERQQMAARLHYAYDGPADDLAGEQQ